ncbi:MAG TPA: TIR domain-containing protein [Stellaceae bacterium]|nr:TIR domain-containing protein [Stellaceae bacterium]
MAGIFLSHSSANNAEAVAVYDWLKHEGWDDVFLDLHPDRGIEAGERWERALHEAASRCEGVLFLVSKAWLASRWCLKELNLAHRLNKPLFGVLIEPVAVNEVPADLQAHWQLVDLASGRDHKIFRVTLPRTHDEVHVTFSEEGLRRLKNGLVKAGLDPRFFPWPPDHDPGRPPYRGLKPVEGDDAGIFFGREAAIIEALDAIRGLRERAAPRLLAILGASGAGKSSFLRAGLLPRLARDDQNFLPLPVIRPERAALGGDAGLIAAIDAALAAHHLAQPRATIRNAVQAGAASVRDLLQPLLAAAADATLTHEPPMLVVAIDQAEELFAADGAEEGNALLEILSGLVVDATLPALILFTIRSDSYDALETAKAFAGMRQHAFPLLPMPRGAYQTIIEGPAARLAQTDRRLIIDPQLTERLLKDVDKGSGSDALPLLAFTLEQLYLDYGIGGALRLSHYEDFGGIRGAIEAAIARVFKAADRDPQIPRDRDARLELLRRGMIPWLAGIDPDTGTPRRRVAHAADIPEESRALIDLMVEQRLLTTDRVRGDDASKPAEITIEPSHEALLRQWELLRQWLDHDAVALTTLEDMKRAARDWAANKRPPDWLNHAGTRLTDAEMVAARGDLARNLPDEARDYLAACRLRENNEAEERRLRAEREKEEQARRLRDAEALATMSQKSARNSRMFAAIGGALSLIALFGGVYAWLERGVAQQEATHAEQNFKVAVDGSGELGKLVHDLAADGKISSLIANSFLEIPSKIIAVLSNEKESDEVLAVEWQLTNTLATAYLSLPGRGDAALAVAQQQKSLALQLLQRKPNDPAYLRDLAVAHDNIGDAFDVQGKLDDALTADHDAEAAMNQILAKTPNDPKSQRDLGYVEERIGDELFKKNDMQAAGVAYQRQLDLFQAIANLPSADPDWVRGLALGHERMGDWSREVGKLDDALAHYQTYAEFLTKLVAQSEAQDARAPNGSWELDLAVIHQRIGEIELRQGKSGDALKEYQIYSDKAKYGRDHDYGGGNWALSFADSDVRLGDAYAALGDTKRASDSYRAALGEYDKLVKQENVNRIPRKDMAIAYDRLGILLISSDPAEAGKQFKQCLALTPDAGVIDRQLPDPRDVKHDCQANVERIASKDH